MNTRERDVVIADAALLVLTIVTLSLSWQSIGRTTLQCAVLAIARLIWRHNARDVLVYAFGFVFASLAEIVQVWAGLYDYAQASPLVIPYYNFFLWGAVLLAAASLLTTMERALGSSLRVSLRALAIENVGYGAITALLCLRGHYPYAIAAVFASLLVVRIAFFYRVGDAWFVLVGVLAGPLVEGWLVHLGMYRFADPAIGNLPLWHPIYWGLIVLYLRRMARLTA